MRLSDKISGSLSSKYDKSILAALNESCEEKKELKEDLFDKAVNKEINYSVYDDKDKRNLKDRYKEPVNAKRNKIRNFKDDMTQKGEKSKQDTVRNIINKGITHVDYEKSPNEKIQAYKDKKRQSLKEDEDLPEVRWDNYEDYSEEEIEEINGYLAKPNLVAIKHEGNKEQGYSVAVKDNNSGLVFWMDYSKSGQDICGEWNQYIFSTYNSKDRIKYAMQSAYTDDWSFFMDVDEVCMAYLLDHGLVSDSEEEGMIFESCETKLDEDIKDDTASAAKQIALEIQERGIMGFDEIDNMAADILGITVEELRDEQLDTDIYISLNYEGIDNNMSTGDFYTQEYAEEHPEVLEESDTLKLSGKRKEVPVDKNKITITPSLSSEIQKKVNDKKLKKEDLKEETLNETDATPEFLEDLKNLINNHMRVDKIESITIETKEYGDEFAVIKFENGTTKRKDITGDSNLAAARAILFELA